jgi:hypothetical protein
MTRRLTIALAAAAVLGLGAGTAAAVDVYLNGNKITGYSEVDFGKVGVTLDAEGNVHIDAPDYQVQEVVPEGAEPTPPPAPKKDPEPPPNPAGLEKQYFIVTQGSAPGATGYDVKLMVNNKFIKSLSDTIPQHVVELNEHLEAGANTISFLAQRKDRQPKGSGADAHFTLLIGRGSADGGQLSIESVLHEFKLQANHQGEKAETFQIQAE